ncbi:hypothetical protein PI125_g22378 [Phytophthora idaei]|nr:hypothetical protein PI125_g22378 [Phytophthora idaei]
MSAERDSGRNMATVRPPMSGARYLRTMIKDVRGGGEGDHDRIGQQPDDVQQTGDGATSIAWI